MTLRNKFGEINVGELPEVTGTDGGCGASWKPQRVAGDVHYLMENALSILIVIFSNNSNKLKPQTESCLFSVLVTNANLHKFQQIDKTKKLLSCRIFRESKKWTDFGTAEQG